MQGSPRRDTPDYRIGLSMKTRADRVWSTFMETPIAELEGYGVSVATIALIEECIGIYIKDIYRSEMIQENTIPYVAGKRMQVL